MNKSNKSSLFKASLMAGLLASALHAEAAGLGKLTVYSAIGQPLSAEVSLTATKEELTSLSAKLASHAAFAEAGIDFAPALTGLRFTVAKASDGVQVLKLSTDMPLNEPFLHFLVELNWATGRVVREYTFLLDPPEALRTAKPASVVPPVVPLKPPATAEKPAAARPVVPAPVQAAAGVPEYRVKQGDTLGKVARETKPEHVSLDQMLVALFNSNRDAFDGANMNRLRAGKILRVPEANQAASIDAGEARKIVISQAADFNAYRRRLAEAAAAAPSAERAPQQLAAGKIEAKVEAKAPSAPSADKLEVSRTEAAKSAQAGKSNLEEELISRDKALKEASARIAQLEKNLENLKQLVEIKSQAGAQLQQQSAPVAAKKPDQPAAAPAAAVPDPAPVVAVKPVEPALPAKPETAKDEPAKSEPTKAEPAKAEATTPPPAKPKPAAPPPPPPPPEPSFIEDSPEIVFGGGGLLALLLAYFGYNAWRKKKAVAQNATAAPVAMDAPGGTAAAQASAPVAAASVASFENAEVSILGDFSESGVLTTDESVDPVAEADVLMAYGRDAQAEEILLAGLKDDPTRTAIHAKLLDLYAQRGDASQFESIATELHALSGGAGEEWSKALALAAGLGITHGIFATTVSPPPLEEESVSAVEAEVPVEAPEEGGAEDAETALPETAAAAEAAPVEAGAGGLDFDLDLGTTSRSAAVEPVGESPAVAAARPADEVMSLDFDFDLGTPSGAPEVAAAAEAMPVEEVVPDAGNSVDFALDEAVGAAVEPPAMEEAGAGEGASVATSDGLDFDLDLGAELPAQTEAAGAEQPVDSLQLGAISLDLGEPAGSTTEPVVDMDLGMDIDLADQPPQTPASAAAIELPSIDLSLDAGDAPAAAAGLPPATESGMDFDLGSLEADGAPPAAETVAAAETDDPEVATKLELAQAYEEMGDREGARELLTEVVNEGSAAQRAAAQARLDQLLV